MTLGLVLADLAVLIYFIHHIATQIQLPQVIAGIANDLAHAVDVQSADSGRRCHSGRPMPVPRCGADRHDGIRRRAVRTPKSGYLQFIRHSQLVSIASEADAVLRLPLPARALPGAGPGAGQRVAPRGGRHVASYLERAQSPGRTGP